MTLLSSRPVEPGLLSRALEVAGRLAADAADVVAATAGRGARPGVPENFFDWVTDTGRTLERHTARVLAGEFPGIPVVGEGSGGDPDGAEYHWVVDPVDGTANYVAGLPWCAYSLALVDAEGPVVGVVADPHRNQLYTAARGRGVRVNGTRVSLPDLNSVEGTIVCTELTPAGIWPGFNGFVSRATTAHANIRVLGSAALTVTQVALGHASAAVLHTYRECDVAAALALALESGAVVLDRRGEISSLPEDGLLVAAPGVAEQVYDWWNS